MLEQILRHLNNWFCVDIHSGQFTVEKGGVALPFLQNGQYFRVIGSVFNDGLHQYPTSDMTEESFDGTIWALAVPKAVIELAAEVEAWQKKNGDAAASPYTSESFGGYSYNKSNGTGSGGVVTWQSVFRDRLKDWRRLQGVKP